MEGESNLFHNLLDDLLSPDNDTRVQAEEAYNAIAVERKVSALMNTIEDTTLEEEFRELAAVLLRKIFSTDFHKFYPQLAPETQNQVKERILLAVQQEECNSIRRKVCEAATELARHLIDKGGNNNWPEVVHFLIHCANSQSEALKETALLLLTSFPGIFGNEEGSYLPLIKTTLQQSLVDNLWYKVRFQAVEAMASFIMLHKKEVSIQRHFSDMLPNFIMVTAESIEKQDDDMPMKCLIDLAQSVPKFLRPQLENILQMCMNVLSNEELSDSWRHLSLEVMITLAETAPAMLRRAGNMYIPLLVTQILKLMTDLDNEAEWSVPDKNINEENDSNAVVGELALDRLACGLGGQTMMPQIENNIPAMLVNPDWRYRHAALTALSSVGEGCRKKMEAKLPKFMDIILNYLQDPHPRVRYAACNAIGQMSTDFGPRFEKKFHVKVIPGLLMVLDDNDNPRVQAHAGAALVNFSNNCPKNILTQYLNVIMAKLESLLHSKSTEFVEKGNKLVLEQVVTTIASIADTSKEQFLQYYERLMPCLKFIIQNAITDDVKILRGKVIECVSLIGLAVGAERFMRDASEVMNILLMTQTEGDVQDDDPQTPYLISAWTRICKMLGKQFEQYLPLVMGPVMKTASMKPEVAMLDNEDLEGLEGDLDWQFISFGEQQNFGIRTSALEDKAAACDMLVCYAKELKEAFADYIEDVVKLMVPMLKFYFHDGIRIAAAKSLPYLLDCAKIKGPDYLEAMWSYVCPELLKAIDTEPENEVLTEHMHSLAECIRTLGNSLLTEEAMAVIIKILDKLMEQHFVKAAMRQEQRHDEDYDEVVEEMLADEDGEYVYILSKVYEIIHSLFLAYKDNFYPFFDQIVGHFVKCLEPQMHWTDHQWALCVFDDTIEYGGPACERYQEFFLWALHNYVTDKEVDVKLAAVYGWGVLGQCGGETFAATVADAVPKLVKVITDPESRTLDNIYPTENAISAITKILKYNSSAINVNEILPHWLSWLPVWEDTEESPHVYGYLCDLIDSNHPIILGPNNVNLPKLIAIIAEAFIRDAIAIESEVGKRMVGIVKQTQVSSELFQACINQLNAEQQQALHQALSKVSLP